MLWSLRSTPLRAIRDRFTALDLRAQFALAGSAVAVAAMLAIGNWVAARISVDLVEASAAASARYMDSFIAPLAQELSEQDTLSIGPIRAIDELLQTEQLKGRVVLIKLWKPDGTLAYAQDVSQIGQRFEPGESLGAAFAGATVTEFDRLDDAENAHEAALGMPLLEIYSPVRAAWSGDVIAVAEFYENATALTADIERARLQGWAVTGLVTLVIGLALFGIVHRGGRMIAQQRRALAERLAAMERLAEQNNLLRRRAENASRRVVEINEANLRRVSADLHDGPAQLVGFASMRLAAVRNGRTARTGEALTEVADALVQAMDEIREISHGLVLPELTRLDLEGTVEKAIGAHEVRSHSTVARDLHLKNIEAAPALKICAYRFVQEGLNNAWRHAEGGIRHVAGGMREGRLHLAVRNPVAAGQAGSGNAEGLGLPGLRERVESLGGTLRFAIDAGEALLAMDIELRKEAANG
jgi:signal transduction histidine kinase